MASLSLEQRVAALEAEVARMRRDCTCHTGQAVPWWEARFGMFANDPEYDEAMRLGREYREAQRLPEDEDDLDTPE